MFLLGKTICAVAVCKEVDIRTHFRKITWVSIGQEAVIEDLQATMYLQITEKPMPQVEDGAAAEREAHCLKLLQGAALQVDGRMLVVLDDPWLPAQVQSLTPLDPASPSKMLVTTRIRGLVKRAVEVPLELLKIEESAKMLMDIGQVEEAEYRTQHPGTDWPPPAALKIVSEPRTVTQDRR